MKKKNIFKTFTCLSIFVLLFQIANATNGNKMTLPGSANFPFLPCVDFTWDETGECLYINPGPTSCINITSDVLEWKNTFGTYVPLPASNSLCGCDVYEFLEVTPVCNVVGSNFVLGGEDFNKCPGRCLSRTDFTFPQGNSNIVDWPVCSQNINCVTISPQQLIDNGGTMLAYYRSNTDFGSVVTIIRFVYNGNGLNCSNISTQIVKQGKIYKDIMVRRTTVGSNCMPNEVCEETFDIPQSPSVCLTESFLNTVNLGTPCSFSGFSANTINLALPATYQWTYNGTNVPQNYTPSLFCLSGQPQGVYCAKIIGADGCMVEACRIYQAACNLGVIIEQSGNYLGAYLSNCTSPSPYYSWSRWNGADWVSVGTNSSSLNTYGLAGEYRVMVTCNSCMAQANIITTTMIPLPIELVSFYISRSDCRSTLLLWETNAEINIQSITLQKSNNGIDYFDLGQSTATKKGNTNKYIFEDIQSTTDPNVVYYRLMSTDFDGKVSFYSVIRNKNNCTSNFSGLKLYPNPSSNMIYFDLENEITEENTTLLVVRKSNGEVVIKNNIQLLNNNGLNVSDLPAGLYLLEIQSNQEVLRSKFIKY